MAPGPPFVRVRPDRPFADGGKYLVPKGSANRLYIPPGVTAAQLADPTLLLILTEGEKKALKGAEVGLLCVALGGVYNWLTKGLDGERQYLTSIAWPYARKVRERVRSTYKVGRPKVTLDRRRGTTLTVAHLALSELRTRTSAA